MGSGGDSDPARRAVISRTLERLKREGSLILVAGDDIDAQRRACSRMLGSTPGATLEVIVTPREPVCSRGRANDGIDREEVVLHPDAYEGTGDEPLTALGTAIVDELEGVADRPTTRNDVRVCLDAVDALLERHGTEPVFRLLHVTGSSIRRARGMGHVHVRRDRSHEWVGVLEPVCEAVLEVRSMDGRPQQRLHLRERQLRSEWIRL